MALLLLTVYSKISIGVFERQKVQLREEEAEKTREYSSST